MTQGLENEKGPAVKVWEGREHQAEVRASAKTLGSRRSIGRTERRPMWLEGGEQRERGPIHWEEDIQPHG